MINIDNIKEIFIKYGYSLEENDSTKYAVFSSGTSMYPAVEIVRLGDGEYDTEIDEIKKQYSESGYAVRICKETNIQEIESYLFNWFFQVKESNRRIQQRYQEYTDSIMESFRDIDDITDSHQGVNSLQYTYISIPYLVERDFSGMQPASESNVVDSIMNDLQKDGSQFIIVEAGAGFGKTSTAFELLNRYKTVEKDIRPFFMELAKDRNATTFRYLLLSQIDSDFRVRLGSDIVLYNIKKGNIPLIIDGFDELLSKDLDNGQLITDFTKVETMLSTIAGLLTDQAKVVLTTRRTAIFAGENFYQWIEACKAEGKNFHVYRYQLDVPSLEDWLPKKRIEKLPSNFSKISNPVLLSYLRYLNDQEFDKAINSSSLVQYYFSSILQREIKRQALPFTADEQVVILRRLATYYAGFNVSAFSRTDVKDAIKELAKDLIQKAGLINKNNKASISNTLTNHAFLDRKGEANIGFINDFVFGMFLMHAIKDETMPLLADYYKDITFPFIEKAIIAGSFCEGSIREEFWKNLNSKCTLNPIASFWADVLLVETNMHDYSLVSLEGRELNDVFLGNKNYLINQCTFSNIIFTSCIFDFEQMKNCVFINCDFVSCSCEGDSSNCEYYGCRQDKCEIISEKHESELVHSDSEDNLDIQILGFYFQVDGRSRRMRMISCIKDEIEEQNPKAFRRIFNSLTRKGYIQTNGDKSFITDKGVEFYSSNRH